MNSTVKWIVIGLAVLVAIVVIASYPVVASAQGPTGIAPYGYAPWGMGPGMTLAPHASAGVGGWWGGYGATPNDAPNTPYGSPYGYGGWGPGRMGRGMMGGYGYGRGWW